jgi:hypothetical protein
MWLLKFYGSKHRIYYVVWGCVPLGGGLHYRAGSDVWLELTTRLHVK